MLIGVFSVGGFMFFHGFASIYPALLLLALAAGLGFSIITPSVNKAVIESSSSDNKALSMGIMQSGGGIGSFAGASLLPLLAAAWSWRLAGYSPFYIPGGKPVLPAGREKRATGAG